ncbi:hypothetical protein GCM10009847_16030 [Leucobacter tardus]
MSSSDRGRLILGDLGPDTIRIVFSFPGDPVAPQSVAEQLNAEHKRSPETETELIEMSVESFKMRTHVLKHAHIQFNTRGTSSR